MHQNNAVWIVMSALGPMVILFFARKPIMSAIAIGGIHVYGVFRNLVTLPSTPAYDLKFVWGWLCLTVSLFSVTQYLTHPSWLMVFQVITIVSGVLLLICLVGDAVLNYVDSCKNKDNM